MTNKIPEFRAKFSASKVPAFEAASGELKVAESDAIAQYVASSGTQAATLLVHTVVEHAQIRQLICFVENEVYVPMLSVVLWRVGLQPFDPQTEASVAKALSNALQIVETQLGRGTGSLVCGRLTLADRAWHRRTIWADGVREGFGEPNCVQVRQTLEE